MRLKQTEGGRVKVKGHMCGDGTRWAVESSGGEGMKGGITGEEDLGQAWQMLPLSADYPAWTKPTTPHSHTVHVIAMSTVHVTSLNNKVLCWNKCTSKIKI